MEAMDLMEQWCKDKGYKIQVDKDPVKVDSIFRMLVKVRGRSFAILKGKTESTIELVDITKAGVSVKVGTPIGDQIQEVLSQKGTVIGKNLIGYILDNLVAHEGQTVDLAEPDSIQRVLAIFAKP